MKVHLVKITRGIWGSDSTKTGSLCGRLNNACRDGMNVTDERSKVTCKFCLNLMGPKSDEQQVKA